MRKWWQTITTIFVAGCWPIAAISCGTSDNTAPQVEDQISASQKQVDVLQKQMASKTITSYLPASKSVGAQKFDGQLLKKMGLYFDGTIDTTGFDVTYVIPQQIDYDQIGSLVATIKKNDAQATASIPYHVGSKVKDIAKMSQAEWNALFNFADYGANKLPLDSISIPFKVSYNGKDYQWTWAAKDAGYTNNDGIPIQYLMEHLPANDLIQSIVQNLTTFYLPNSTNDAIVKLLEPNLKVYGVTAGKGYTPDDQLVTIVPNKEIERLLRFIVRLFDQSNPFDIPVANFQLSIYDQNGNFKPNLAPSDVTVDDVYLTFNHLLGATWSSKPLIIYPGEMDEKTRLAINGIFDELDWDTNLAPYFLASNIKITPHDDQGTLTIAFANYGPHTFTITVKIAQKPVDVA